MSWTWETEAIAELADLLRRPAAELLTELAAIEADAHPVEGRGIYRLGRRYQRVYLVTIGSLRRAPRTVVEVRGAHVGHGTERRRRPSGRHRALAHQLQRLGIVAISPAFLRDLSYADVSAVRRWIEARERGEEPVTPGFLRGLL